MKPGDAQRPVLSLGIGKGERNSVLFDTYTFIELELASENT